MSLSSAGEIAERRPEISVVVPVHERAQHADSIVAALKPALACGRAELILVANGLDPRSLPVQEHPGLRILTLPGGVGPYAARNAGVLSARAEYIALVDANCFPDDAWLDNGLAALKAAGGIVAGKVWFRVGAESSAAELWDSVINVQQRRSVARGVAKTANLFLSRSVIDRAGGFDETRRSGEDVRWTRDAARQGVPLSYCATAIVYKDPRGWRPLCRKARRVGAGQAALLKRHSRIIKLLGLMLMPPQPAKICRAARRKGDVWGAVAMIPSLLVISQLVQWSQALGLAWPDRFRDAD